MAEHVHSAPHGAGEHHEELGFWRKYIFSVDHKVIGIQYAVTGLTFLFFGFFLMMLMRWQLAYPGEPIPFIGGLFSDARAPGGSMLPDFYNELGAMHGTIMVFLGVVPLAVGGFGNFVLPLQIGAPDMAFPKLNMLSYWSLFLGGMTTAICFIHCRIFHKSGHGLIEHMKFEKPLRCGFPIPSKRQYALEVVNGRSIFLDAIFLSPFPSAAYYYEHYCRIITWVHSL